RRGGAGAGGQWRPEWRLDSLGPGAPPYRGATRYLPRALAARQLGASAQQSQWSAGTRQSGAAALASGLFPRQRLHHRRQRGAGLAVRPYRPACRCQWLAVRLLGTFTGPGLVRAQPARPAAGGAGVLPLWRLVLRPAATRRGLLRVPPGWRLQRRAIRCAESPPQSMTKGNLHGLQPPRPNPARQPRRPAPEQ